MSGKGVVSSYVHLDITKQLAACGFMSARPMGTKTCLAGNCTFLSQYVMLKSLEELVIVASAVEGDEITGSKVTPAFHVNSSWLYNEYTSGCILTY